MGLSEGFIVGFFSSINKLVYEPVIFLIIYKWTGIVDQVKDLG